MLLRPSRLLWTLAPCLAFLIAFPSGQVQAQDDNAGIYLQASNGVNLYHGAKLYGAMGQETVRIHGGSGISVDQNIERIELVGDLATYSFTQGGNTLGIHQGGQLLATVVVQGDADGTIIACNEGSISLKLIGPILYLGNYALSATASTPTIASLGTSINATSGTGAGRFSSNSQPNQIYFNDDGLLAVSDAAKVYGTKGTEHVQLLGAPQVTVDQNIEHVELDGALSDYHIQQHGNTVEITLAGALVGTVVVQGDADGTRLAFRDGWASLKLVGPVMQLGNQALSDTTPTGFTAAQLGTSFNAPGSGEDTVQTLLMTQNASGASASFMEENIVVKDSVRYFKVTVPDGVTNLVIRTEGEGGNPNLYVERGAKPTLALSVDASYCASTGAGTVEQCVYATPQAGDYYILVYGVSAYVNVTLTVNWDKESGYSVTTHVSPGGSISPSSKTVTQDSTADFVLIPQSGYSIDSVIGCNGNLSGNLYVTSMITAPCTVTATFSQNVVEEQEEGVMQGYFRDAPVGGLGYSSCNWDGTKCLTGFTDANGMYFYKDGNTIKFELGKLFLLETKGLPLLTPENATSNDSDSNRLARFLQGLDDDGDLTNGINISEKTRELANDTTVTRVLEIDDQQFERIAEVFTNKMPSADVASAHLSATTYLAAMDSIDNKYTKWILNKVAIPSTFNREILSNSAAARLKYAIWQDISASVLLNSNMTDTVESTEKIDKIASIMVDLVKTLVQIATLDLEKIGETGAVLQNMSIAADVLKIHVDIFANGAKMGYVIGDKETDNIEYTSGMIKAALSSVMQLNVADATKEIIGVSVDDESDKLTTELLGSVFAAFNAALLDKPFKLDIKTLKNALTGINPKGILIDYYANGIKAAVKVFLSAHLASNRSNAEAYQFAYDYLDAYYKSGGDSVFMLQQPIPMPLNVFTAVSNKVNSDWLETVIGDDVFTKRMYAINLVKKYMNQVESTYLDIGSVFGGFPEDDLFIKFANPNERFICAGGYVQAAMRRMSCLLSKTYLMIS